MQTIYVDVFFFINMFVDFLLLFLLKRIIRSNVKYYRLILSSVIGACFSFSALLPFNHFPINIFINILSLSILSLICFGFKNIKQFLKNTTILLIISFLFSGAMIYLYTAFKPESMIIINNAVYFNISPLMLILLSCLIYFLLFLIKKVFKNHTNSFLVHNVRFKYKDNEYNVKCKTDSGLNLKEPFSGDNVIVIESSEVYIADKSAMRVIPFHSLGGNGIIYGFKAEFVFIDAKRINEEIYIGLCEGIFKNEIKGLIPDFFTEG